MRLWIAAGFAILFALPPLLGAPPAFMAQTHTVRSAQALPVHVERDPADSWTDFARTVAATFIGAGLAFLANLEVQRRARRREEIAAANFALATLARQYNGLLQTKTTIDEQVAMAPINLPGAPLWLAVLPMIHFREENLAFDFESLTFLFEEANVEWFKHLHQAETMYRDMFGHVRRLSENAVKKQEKLEAAGVVPGNVTAISIQQLILFVGPRLQGELDSGVGWLLAHCSAAPPKYLEAADELYRLLSQRFGPGVRLLRVLG